MKKFGLRAARVNANLKQTDAALEVGVSVSTIRNWEKGRSFPNEPKIRKLCKLYGVDFDQIDFEAV